MDLNGIDELVTNITNLNEVIEGYVNNVDNDTTKFEFKQKDVNEAFVWINSKNKWAWWKKTFSQIHYFVKIMQGFISYLDTRDSHEFCVPLTFVIKPIDF